MTEFEMAYLMADMQSGLMTSTTTLFTITSAFLVAGYVAGRGMSRLTAVVVVAVFAWAFLTTAFLTGRQIINVLGLAQQIHEYAAAGKGLSWHAASTAVTGRQFFGNLAIFNFFCGTVFIASVFFFLHCRSIRPPVAAQRP